MRQPRTLATLITIAAMAVGTSGCGSSSTSPAVLTFVQRASADSYANPSLYSLDPATKAATPVSITLNPAAIYVAANRDATAATYCRESSSSVDDIFYVAKGGQETQLTTGADACLSPISPTGDTIAYEACPSYCSIYLMNLDGSNPRAWLSTPGYDQEGPWFSADGSMISFYMTQGSSDDEAEAGVLAKGNATKWWRRGHRSGAGKSGAAGSPTPQTSSYATGWYVASVSNPTPTLVYAVDNAFVASTFSSDGKSLLISVPGDAEIDIVRVGLDGSNPTTLVSTADALSLNAVDFGGEIYFNQITSEDEADANVYSIGESGSAQSLFLSGPAETYDWLIDTTF